MKLTRKALLRALLASPLAALLPKGEADKWTNATAVMPKWATRFVYTSGGFASWNVALTAEEIAALGQGVSPMHVRPQNLTAYFPLDSAMTHDER